MGIDQIALSSGTIDYRDTGGTGPVIVFLHGLLMDSSLWDAPIAELSADHRCIAPTLPMGAHRQPMSADADLGLTGLAGLVRELLERLELTDVTLVGNDTGGAVAQLVAATGEPRVGRLMLVSCEAFDNLPPGLTGHTLALTAKLPPVLFGAFMQQMRLRPMRRLPVAFGWLTKRGDEAAARWMHALLARADIRRETVRMLRAVFSDKRILVRAAEQLAAFDRPALVVWAAKDRVMPPEHGRRLAELLPQGRLVEVEDSDTLIPLDQPAAIASAVRSLAPVA